MLFGDDVGSIMGVIEGDTRSLEQTLWRVAQDSFLVFGPDESNGGGWKELLTHWGLAVTGGSPKPLHCVSVLGPVPFAQKPGMILTTVHLKPQTCGVITSQCSANPKPLNQKTTKHSSLNLIS